MPDTNDWIAAVRSSHDRLTSLLTALSAEQVTQPSYDEGWSIADVASHLGSQAEIFELFLAAGLGGDAAPGGEVFGPIWDRWNVLPPTQQVAESISANEALVTRLEQIPETERRRFALSMFGMDLDLAGLASMRLGEHALHTWDIGVAIDPAVTVAADAVDLLVDTLVATAARAGKPVPGAGPVAIVTTAPDRRFLLTVDPVVTLVGAAVDSGDSDGSGGSGEGPLQLPAEAFVRLVAGRLDPAHTPDGVADDGRLGRLRTVFPGF